MIELPPGSTPELSRRLARVADELPYLSRIFAGIGTVLDIGCGPAVTSIQLAVAIDLDTLFLMDGKEGDKLMGYHEEKSPWVDPALAGEIAALNGINHVLVKPDPSLTVPCGGIMSLLSWGHHYPVSVYLPLALRSIARGSPLVLDLRKERGGFDELQAAGFEPIEKLAETEKLERYHFQKAVD